MSESRRSRPRFRSRLIPMTTIYTLTESPVGELLLTGEKSPTGTTLTSLTMPDQPTVPADWERDDQAFTEATRQLSAYFAGHLTRFELPWPPRERSSSSGYGEPWTRSPTARRRPTAPSRNAWAYRAPRSEPWARHSAPTHSCWCARATG